VDVDSPRLAREVGAPDVLEQGVTAQNDAGIAGQRGEKIELAGAETEVAAGHGRLAAARIDPQGADLHRPAASCRRLRAAKDRLDPGDERPRVEGLRDVVVGTELETDDRIDVVVPCRQHQDRRVATPPDLATDGQAVDLRQHEVEDHEIGVVPRVSRERLLAVGRGHDREPLLLEVQPDQVDDVPLVVDDEDRLHRLAGFGGVARVIAAEDTPPPARSWLGM